MAQKDEPRAAELSEESGWPMTGAVHRRRTPSRPEPNCGVETHFNVRAHADVRMSAFRRTGVEPVCDDEAVTDREHLARSEGSSPESPGRTLSGAK